MEERGTVGQTSSLFFQAEHGIRDRTVTGVQTCALPIYAEAIQAAAKKLGGAALEIECNVTDRAAVRRAFDRVAMHFGGVDIVVSNAGAAAQGRIGERSEERRVGKGGRCGGAVGRESKKV